MRNSFKYIFAAATMLLNVAAFAQTDVNAIQANKSRSEADANGVYTLTLDTYVTGNQEVIIGHETIDTQVDALLVVDVSGSMDSNMQSIKASQMIEGKPEGFYKYSGRNARMNNGQPQQYRNGEWQSLDPNNTVTTSRMMATKDAINIFIDNLASKSKDGIEHRINIVTFSTDTSTVVKWTKITPSTISNLKKTINGLRANGSTYSDKAMARAVENAKFYRNNDNSNNVVIFFTDGYPGYSATGFEDPVANGAIKQANLLKEKATVFSVSVYKTTNDKMHRYLNYVSSNYKPVSSSDDYLNWRPTPDDGKTAMIHDNYFFADSPQELEKIFTEISEKANPTGGAGYVFKESDNVTVKDIITPAFTIPEGGKVSLYSVPIKKIDAEPYWAFDEGQEAPFTGATLVVSEDKQTVTLQGYNFSEHWCGPIRYYNDAGDGTKGTEITDRRKANSAGALLRIKIEIVETGEGEGGVQYTNGKESGIYVNGQPTVPIKNYTMPVPVESNDIDLVITRNDLKEGQSTIYNVTRNDGFTRKVAVSAVKDGANEVKAETRLRVVARDASKNLYIYKVEEDHTWDWTTTHAEGDNVMQKKLIDESDAKYPLNDNHFDFGVTERTDVIPNNDETFVRIK